MANQNTLADFSTTAASNTNWIGQSIQGTAPILTIDEMLQNLSAMLAGFYDSLGGSLTAGGTATALTVTITEDWAAYAHGNILAIKTASAASGASTLTVTVPTAGSLGSKKIRRQGDTAIQANDWLSGATILLKYDSAYDSAAGAWVLLNPASAFTGGTLTSDLALSTSTNVTTSPPLQFSGDANTGIGHSAADTLDFTVGGVDVFQIGSTGARTSVIPSGSTLLPLFDCRAWVNFNGTGTVAIRGSGNVSSITDNGTGDYTVNFTTAMPDANYVFVEGRNSSGSGGTSCTTFSDATRTTTTLRLLAITGANVVADSSACLIAVFR